MKELRNNGPQLKGTYAGNQLKLFYKRQHFIYNIKDEVSKWHFNNIGAALNKEDILSANPLDLENSEHITKQHIKPNGIVIRVPILTFE